jgi:hypothetical protein
MVVVEDDLECVQDDETKKFFCRQCKYITNTNNIPYSFKQYLNTRIELSVVNQ